MLILKGQCNSAHIMIDEIDETTRQQIQRMLDHPAFANTYIAIMPDCHAGKGAVIGFTMKMNEYIIPDIVGVDIGCGVLAARFPVTLDEIDLPAFDKYIKKTSPPGSPSTAHPRSTMILPFATGQRWLAWIMTRPSGASAPLGAVITSSKPEKTRLETPG